MGYILQYAGSHILIHHGHIHYDHTMWPIGRSHGCCAASVQQRRIACATRRYASLKPSSSYPWGGYAITSPSPLGCPNDYPEPEWAHKRRLNPHAYSIYTTKS